MMLAIMMKMKKKDEKSFAYLIGVVYPGGSYRS